MTGYVLRRVGSPRAWVAPAGSHKSYTNRRDKARVFPTREAAEADACGNEVVEPL